MRTFTQKLAFLLLTLLWCAGLPIQATEVTIGNPAGTSTSTTIPLYSYYNYSVSQQIYTAAEIEEAGGGAGTITSLKLYLYGSASLPTFNVNIYMKEVDKASFTGDYYSGYDWVDLTEDDLVYSSDQLSVTNSSPVQEYEFVLDNPFAYEGTGNLLICINNITGSYASGFNGLVETQSSSTSIYANRDTPGAYDVTALSSLTSSSTSYSRNVITLDILDITSACERVEAVEITDIAANRATVNWTGGNGTYLLEYKLSSADKFTEVSNLTGSSYTLTDLAPNSAYSVRVTNVCGPELVSSPKSASFTTLIGLPFTEQFATSSLPSGWSRYSGLLNQDGSATLSSTTSGWQFNTGNGVFNNHARVNIYGSSCKYWLVTPAIPMEEGQQLSFDLALTTYGGTNTQVDPSKQSDDRFVVLISNDGGSNWITLREWNNSGSEYVYNAIAYTAEGEPVEIIIPDDYAGQTVLIAFYGESTQDGGDNNLHIDNVKIAAVPTCFKPTDLHEVEGKPTKSSVQLDWTPNTEESAWKLQYKKVSDSEWNKVDVASKPFTLSGLETFTEYNIQVAADCGGGDVSDYSKVITVKTAAGVPFAQGFNIPSIPSEWKRYTGLLEDVENGEELEAVSEGWTIAGSSSSKNGVFPDSASHLILNIAGANTKHWIVSPIIEMEAGYQLSFDLALTKSSGTLQAPTAGAQQDDKFVVAVNEGEGWGALRQWTNGGAGLVYDEINATANGQVVKIDLAAYAGKSIQLALYGESTQDGGDNNLHISNFKIALPPACEPASELNITGIGGTFATAVWNNEEDAVWQVCLRANPAADFVPADDDFVTLAAGVYSVSPDTLAENTNYGFFLRRKCGEADFSEMISRSFKTIQTPVVLDSENSFSDNFESGNKWVLINGTQTNQWALGTAVSNGGSHALYISNDAGVSNAMTYAAYANTSYVYASKTFTFAETGVYTFSYDWKNNGGSSYYLRVYLAPLDAEPAAGSSAPYTGWTKLHSASDLYGQSDWQQESFEYRIEEAGTYKVILHWYNYYSYYGSSNYDPPAAVDNFSISRLSCPRPENLRVTEVTAETATFSWDDATDGTFEYAYALASEEQPEEFTPVTETSVAIEGLAELTDYKFYLRKSCGATDKSVVVSVNFTTDQLPVVVGNGFTDDFEDGLKWILINGNLTNQWVLGSAVNNGGSHALYISNDAGVSNAYNTSSSTVVYATKTFTFAETGVYTFSFDWRNKGESGDYDYLRVVLAPAAVDLVAGTSRFTGLGADISAVPVGWKALDGGKMNNVTDWQHSSIELAIEEPGDYKVVMMFYCDSYSGTNPPAAVDNFSITKVVCQMPGALRAVADSTTVSSALLTWTPNGTEENWLVRYRKSGTAEWSDPIAVAHIAGNAFDSLKIESLDPSSTYEAQVAALCDPSDPESASDYSASINFATACGVVASLNENFDAVTTGSGNVLPLCWSYINTSTNSSYNYYPKVYGYSANSGSNCLQFYSYYSSSTDYDPRDQYAILPEFTSVSDKRIKLNARAYSTGSYYDATFIVGVMTDPANASTFVPVATFTPATTSYEPFVASLNSYTGEGKFIAIKMAAAYSSTGSYFYRSLYIDDIIVEDLPSCLEPSGLVAELTQGNGSVASLSWTAGADETAWTVEYSVNADFSDAVSQNVSENPSLNLSGLTPETVYYARVKAVCGEGDESVWSDAVSFKPTDKFLLLVNDGTSTGSYVPFYGYYADGEESHSQFIIPASDLVALQWDTITQLTFYTNTESVDCGDDRFEVYMAETEATTLSGLDWTSLTKVRNAATVTISNNQMVITLDAPFRYEDGNLLVGFKQTSGSTYTTSFSWIGKTATYGNSYYHYYNMDDSYESAYQSSFLPKMLIEYKPGEAPACLKPTALAAALTDGDGTVAALSWTAGADETAWVVEYSRNADFSDALSESVSETPALNLTNLTAEATYYARVKAVCGEGIESDWSNAVSFKPTSAVSFTINRGSATNQYVPVYGYYVYNFSRSQFIIPADSLASIQWATINKLTFRATQSSLTWNNAKFEVYMAPAAATTISAFADWSSMTKVMAEAHLEVADNQLVIALDEPYLYEGGNLLIGIYQTVKGAYGTSTWYGVTATGASMGGYSSSAGADGYPSQQNFLPELTISYVPGEEPTCYTPAGLVLSNITSDGVKAVWNSEDGALWQYAVALASDPAPESFTDMDTNAVVISGLANDNTDYIFYLRKNCGGEDGVSKAVSAKFHTLQMPVAVPFADDFEDGNKWVLINGVCTNGWALGEAAHAGESGHALYISEDGGASYSYEGYASSAYSMVYAEKAFTFDEGNYIFSYDWKCQGYINYGTPYDFLRVALVPVSVELAASSASYSYAPTGFTYNTLPAGWIALDGGAALNGSAAWQSQATEELAIPAGTYKVVFAWRNATSNYSGSDPAAVDNFSIAKVACAAPTAVTAGELTATTAAISWIADPEQTAWQIAYDTIATNQPDTLLSLANIADNPHTLSLLEPEHTYYVYVRANCDEDVNSAWANGTFRTASLCQTPDALAAANIGLTSAEISWNTYGQTGFNLRYKEVGAADWTTVDNAAVPQAIDGLTPSTSYQVQVQAACEDADSWSAAFTFKTAYGIPFEEKFATSSAPEDWNRYSGLLSEVQAGTALTSGTAWSFGSRNGIFNGNHAYVNIYGSSSNKWLATPAITLTEAAQLSFDLALTKYNSSTAVTAGQQDDDKFVVLISTDNGATWTVLRQWDNAGSGFVYDEITNNAAGQEVIINLSAYTGQSVIVAFYGESTVSADTGGDNDLHIDNVLIDKIPTCPKQTGLTISEVSAHTAKLAWTAGAEEQDAWQIALDTIAGFNPDTLSSLIDVTENPFVLSGLLPQHTYYVYVRANCGVEDGVSRWTDVNSFRTTIACPAPTALVAALTPGNGAVATLNWTAGAVETDWIVEYSVNADFSDAVSVPVAGDPALDLTALTAETTYYARVKADCGELDGESLWSASISFTPTDRYELMLNDGSTTNSYVPVYGNYAENYSLGQFIVPAAQLEAILWDSIQALTFYASNANVSWGDAQFEAYVAEVEETAFASATLNDWEEMILVKAAASLSVADGKMVVTFDEPYQYEGGNLMIGIKETVYGSYSNVNWYGVSASGASVGGYKNKNTGALTIAQRNFLPKMLITYVPGVEPACKKPTGLVVSDIAAFSAIVAWDEIEGAEWEYAVLPAADPAPESFELSTSARSVVLDQLSENTEYVFYLRQACGEDGNGAVVSIAFATDIQKAAIPFYEDFETPNTGWKLVNGDQPNAWMIGDGAASTGENALYISSDGSENTYNKEAQSSAFAYILLDFDKGGNYRISYEWKANGDYDLEVGEIYDFLRVVLVPASVSFEAGDADLPAGAIALDGGEQLYGAEGWRNFSAELENVSAGVYKLVFAWFNDDAYGDDTPAAIDNIAVVHTSYPTDIQNGAGIENQAVKFIRDNHVYILLNGNVYNITGQKMELK